MASSTRMGRIEGATMIRSLACLLTLMLSCAATASADQAMADVKAARDFSSRDFTVLVFLYTDCPVANGMAPELTRIQKDYASKGVTFFRVYADSTLTDEAIARHGHDYKLDFPAVRDNDLELVRLTGAQITPEAVVYDRKGERRYRGRINNKYEDLGKYRRNPTQHDLRDALDALLAGKPVSTPETKAIGCYLPQPKDAPESAAQPKEPQDDARPASE
jgi:hypothetical protein